LICYQIFDNYLCVSTAFFIPSLSMTSWLSFVWTYLANVSFLVKAFAIGTLFLALRNALFFITSIVITRECQFPISGQYPPVAGLKLHQVLHQSVAKKHMWIYYQAFRDLLWLSKLSVVRRKAIFSPGQLISRFPWYSNEMIVEQCVLSWLQLARYITLDKKVLTAHRLLLIERCCHRTNIHSVK
jgi:hypothetical protein